MAISGICYNGIFETRNFMEDLIITSCFSKLGSRELEYASFENIFHLWQYSYTFRNMPRK
jgi:hypothetical protein